jgi:hypothetical protein
MKCFLEVGIEDIKEAITEAPHEEQSSNKTAWYNTLSKSNLGSTSNLSIVNALTTKSLLLEFNDRRTTVLLRFNFFVGRLRFTANNRA